jgi:hypothetical protein
MADAWAFRKKRGVLEVSDLGCKRGIIERQCMPEGVSNRGTQFGESAASNSTGPVGFRSPTIVANH